ncbi:alpha-D-ribose 1-methylphosphonate 5-triphosphate synthase subunit PhnG [Propionibacteriaceae bacterium ES.041]|uniref:Phosphonate metabolism protein PhnG n=1 Tax=Enemella evansiae TaxID=2016499 RepID=A0A255GAL7_9ACTN|nr:phosphonate C-P lyase system protein PhnG [Enemella evansiae]PFG65485.1 alpha-D-ribose 1-methylphosphonate 5-triphosphate synthase subunit PhnG [Propionibacteriaceae bacterium ES.041]OYN96258.1 phosphonate metabolism protein PhnG [Enemella evansiae]OYO11049.1 phosphonate metabolism protein PhnG [Enemella evansiae]OYO12885.1 phosphonate metabolism protein PhnG [Enemella evansiae]OYO19736.1 phosphonate metabolism protein PhnG [Enemella evansiae]
MTETHTREELAEQLSLADPSTLVEIAELCLDAHDLQVVRGPEVGTVATQVREPIAGTRFLLADVLASSAEVRLAGTPGWAMRMGADPEAALAQAICDAELQRDGAYADRLRRLCADVATTTRMERAAEWERLCGTIVEFEEIP